MLRVYEKNKDRLSMTLCYPDVKKTPVAYFDYWHKSVQFAFSLVDHSYDHWKYLHEVEGFVQYVETFVRNDSVLFGVDGVRTFDDSLHVY